MDPITAAILGLALTAGGVGANSMAQQQQAAARRQALDAEAMRQAALDREAAALNEASRTQYEDLAGQQGDKAVELASLFIGAPQAGASAAGNAGVQAQAVLPTASSNSVVTNEVAKQNAKAKRFTTQQGQARGNLRAFGDVMGDLGRSTAENARQVGTIGSFKAGSSNVLPFELDDANSKGANWRLLGDVLSGLGATVGTAGITGAAAAGSMPAWLAPISIGTRQVAPVTAAQSQAAFAGTGGVY